MFESKDIDLYPKYIEFVKNYIKDFYSYDEKNYIDIVSIEKKIIKDHKAEEWTFEFRVWGRSLTRKHIAPKKICKTIAVISYHKWLRLYLKEERNRRIIEIINSKPKRR